MVQCSVLICFKNSAKTNKASNVTFHRFPKNVNCKIMWTEATGRVDWAPPKGAVICSVHFEESCFFNTFKGQRKLMEGSIPTKLLPKVKNTSSTFTSIKEEPYSDTDIEIDEELDCNQRYDQSSSTLSFLSISSLTPDDDLRKLSDTDTPTEKKMKMEILKLDNIVNRQQKNLKRLWQKNRRYRKKITLLEEKLVTVKSETLTTSIGETDMD